MSCRTLQRQFMGTVGMSPIEWITRQRIGLAKDLLETTDDSLTSIAAQSGFRSIESFRRHFRHVAGTTPAAYRARFGYDSHQRS
jgi:AraC family transcriptional activator FtrA